MDGCITFSIRKSCLLLLLAFCCILRCCANAAGEKQRPPIKSAVVVGTVYCDTCFLQKLSKSGHFIPGATVAVECRDSKAKSRFRKETKTNRHGVFRVHLPLSVSRHIDSIKSCQVSLIKSSQPFCAAAASATSAGLSLKHSRRNGVLVFSAGFFAFKPLTQPELCYQELKPLDPAKPAFIPFFPPIPLLPPPSLLPPVIPSPPPSVLPPFFPTPPPSLLPPILPPVPGIPLPLLSPPPPPPASIFPPFPFPLPPNPLFPGIPPASPPAETLP